MRNDELIAHLSQNPPEAEVYTYDGGSITRHLIIAPMNRGCPVPECLHQHPGVLIDGEGPSVSSEESG